MTSKFEQLIEYVINDEEAKAKELFHDIVVEKSREIYENLMDESEELDEESTHDEDDKAEKAGREVAKDIEYDDKKDRMDEEEEELDEMMGGDASDDLIDDVEADEEGMEMSEEEGEEFGAEDEAGEDLEDRVVDLEDKLDELMAEFEALMGGEEAGEEEMDVELDPGEGGDALEMDDTEEFMNENVSLDKAPAPTTTEPAGTNTKSTVAFNSGAKGMQGAPVKMTGDTAQGRPAPKTADLPEAGKFKNVPGKGSTNAKLDAAPKPHLAQATGVNTKTPFPKA
jgi:hypothetical protein